MRQSMTEYLGDHPEVSARRRRRHARFRGPAWLFSLRTPVELTPTERARWPAAPDPGTGGLFLRRPPPACGTPNQRRRRDRRRLDAARVEHGRAVFARHAAVGDHDGIDAVCLLALLGREVVARPRTVAENQSVIRPRPPGRRRRRRRGSRRQSHWMPETIIEANVSNRGSTTSKSCSSAAVRHRFIVAESKHVYGPRAATPAVRRRRTHRPE